MMTTNVPESLVIRSYRLLAVTSRVRRNSYAVSMSRSTRAEIISTRHARIRPDPYETAIARGAENVRANVVPRYRAMRFSLAE